MCSQAFREALQRVGAQAELVLYEGKTHTDLFLQASDVLGSSCFVFLLFELQVQGFNHSSTPLLS